MRSYANTTAKLAAIATGGRVTFTDGEDSPVLTKGVTDYVTANTTATDYLDFDTSAFDADDGIQITIEINDGNSSIVNSADIKLNGGVDFAPGSGGGTITLRHRGGTWYQVGGTATF